MNRLARSITRRGSICLSAWPEGESGRHPSGRKRRRAGWISIRLNSPHHAAVQATLEAHHGAERPWNPKHYFKLKRGPYLIVSVLEESISAEPLNISGPIVDLFDSKLSVLDQVTLSPGNKRSSMMLRPDVLWTARYRSLPLLPNRGSCPDGIRLPIHCGPSNPGKREIVLPNRADICSIRYSGSSHLLDGYGIRSRNRAAV